METPKRIVVADDDSKVRRLLELALKAPEFEVRSFPTGAEALRALPDIRPSCVVSDMLMPDMDGEGLLRGLRAIPGMEDTPFIVVSAIRSEARIQSVLEAGAAAFMLKPFPVKDLIAKIRSLLEGAAPPTAAGGPRPPASSSPDAAPPGGQALLEELLDGAPEAPPSTRRTELRAGQGSLGFGRYTKVTQGRRSFVVLTEIDVGPRFTVTTVISERGVGRRKIQTSLQHPLARQEDRDVVRRQVDHQHEEAIENLPQLIEEGPARRVVWSDQSRTVDASVLAWTVSALAQTGEAEAGVAETVRVLRRTREQAALRQDDLRVFEVTDSGRVVVASDRKERLPRRAVGAVAGWCLAFATEILQTDEDAVLEPIRQATRQRGGELERLGFYERLRHGAAS